jgi:hypothetical protein
MRECYRLFAASRLRSRASSSARNLDQFGRLPTLATPLDQATTHQFATDSGRLTLDSVEVRANGVGRRVQLTYPGRREPPDPT